jgi:two-component system cell cycle sensor histidine kinase/response regulator CckA
MDTAPGPHGSPLSLVPGSLRARLILSTAVLLGLLAAFLVSYIPVRLERHTLELTAHRAASIAEMTAYNLAAALVFEDLTAMEEVFQGARRNLDVLYLVLEGADGAMVVADNLEAALEAGYAGAESGTATEDGAILRVSARVGPADRAGGTLHLGLSLGDVRAYVAETRRNVALVTLLLFGLGGVGFAGISTLVTRPVRRIVETMEGVTAGDLGRRTGLRSRDELGYVGSALDVMIERLQVAHGALREHNRTLEERVEERTRALRVEMEERGRAEEALHSSERRFRAMFESSVSGIAIFAADATLLGTNAAMRRMLGLPESWGRGTPAGERALVQRIHPDDRWRWSEGWGRSSALRSGEPAELRWLRDDGTTVWTRVVLTGVRQEEGDPFVMLMAENITQERALESQLRQSQKLEAVGQLAGGVAHDFNNLLTTINGIADLASSEYAHLPSLTADLREIRKAGERAATLTAQLLAFSRRQMLQPEEVDVGFVVRDMAAMLRRLIGPTIRLELDLSPDTHALRADPGQLTQVFMNLVVNARDAMPTGGILLVRTRNVRLGPAEASACGAARPGDFVEITVSDTGHGMDELTRSRVFEPFFTSKPRGKGTGLGLATVHGIVHQSGGGITVESEPGEGTTFTLVLPSLGRAGQLQPAPEAEPASEPGRGTILLVEDESAVRAVLARFLRRAGYQVLEARDGIQGLERFRTGGHRVDAVVTDVIMPRMSGPRMVRELVRDAPELPVLYVSGFTENEALDLEQRDAGRYAFLSKPLAPDELMRRLAELLEPGGTEAAAGAEPGASVASPV